MTASLSSSSQQPNGDGPLLLSNSTPFPFSCKCLNLKVNGRIPTTEESRVSRAEKGEGSRTKLRVFLPAGAENTKLSGYATYDQDDFDKSTTSNEAAVDEDTLGPSWRKCWLCDTKCYQAGGKERSDPPAEEEWVTVELGNGIIYGDEIDAERPAGLPFSGLQLDGPSGSSNFGRPPSQSAPPLYPSSTASTDGNRLIPPPHDPFFLPPPFIPSHPNLRDLCDSAGDHLREAHVRLEDEVKHFIASKAQEMRDLEERVRGEVEMLWDRYKAGPGKGEDTERSRSASTGQSSDLSRPQSKDRAMPQSKLDDNPIAKAATSPSAHAPPPGNSLLAQSLSANTFYAPAPKANAPSSVKNEITKTLDHVASTYGKKDDNRAVAMSYVLSTLNDHMGSSAGGASQTRRRSSSTSNGNTAPGDKDSWIEEERATLRSAGHTSRPMSSVEEEDPEGRTPKPKAVKQLQTEHQETGEKSKGKGRVTFEDPKADEKKESTDDGGYEDQDVEDTVFDMEMDDSVRPKRTSSETSPSGGLAHLPISRTRNMVEANLSHTFAADAPSHRAAWRRIEEKGSMYASLRRESTSSDGDEEGEDENNISKLAMSMPMAIHLPKPKSRHVEVPEFERKTSLSERQGLLVPPLLKAMRERGIPQTNSLGLTPSRGRPSAIEDDVRRNSRTASVSREREQMQSYRQDPGAVFESLADDGQEDDDDSRDDEEEGTLRDNKGFVPPHVLARQRQTGMSKRE